MAFGLSAGAVSLIGAGVGALGSMSGGEGGTQTADRSPWLDAQPWIKSNITAGQGLQDYYTANPFNQGQKQAYGNMAATSDYMRGQLPQLLGTLNQQGGGFDRNNVNARPPSFQFGSGGANLGLGPAYGSASSAMTNSLATPVAAPAPVAAAPAVEDKPWEKYGLTQHQWWDMTTNAQGGGA